MVFPLVAELACALDKKETACAANGAAVQLSATEFYYCLLYLRFVQKKVNEIENLEFKTGRVDY